MGEYAIKHNDFEGPLDLLLTLINERKLYINEVSLAEVTNGYIAYVQQLATHPLAETAQFVLVASTLLLIKSRSLLPDLPLSTEEEGGIEDLKSRLAHYQKVRDASKHIRERWGAQPLSFPLKQPYQRPIIFNPGEATAPILHQTLLSLLRALPVHTFKPEAVVERVISLEEMIVQVRDRVLRAARTRFSELAKGATKGEVVLQFLALLELVKGGFVQAQQAASFDDILLESQLVETPHYGI
ncbi:MAG: segregation/condensation protein A [Candidatus Pacebacteria bacterium]|nr:segregation/condensation protein A [Candidatus Paceibacterota bacterium]